MLDLSHKTLVVSLSVNRTGFGELVEDPITPGPWPARKPGQFPGG